MKKLVPGALAGALLAWFLDPQSGARRRHAARDRVLAFLRRRGRGVEGAGQAVASDAYGVVQTVRHRGEEPKDLNDATLAQKVESEIFREPELPKGDVNVNVQEGVVQLRGEVERPELIDELVDRARAVQGVKGVENLLHTPGTPAPMHQ